MVMLYNLGNNGNKRLDTYSYIDFVNDFCSVVGLNFGWKPAEEGLCFP